MSEKIVKAFIAIFGGLTKTTLGKEILVFLISVSPIMELRGGLLAASLLGLDPLPSYILSVIGNILPIPFILWFMGKIIKWMREKNKLKKIVNWVDKKVEKNKDKIEKYGFTGLVLLVAIPLPGTGAWTACLVAAVLDLDKKKSFISTVIGVLLASIIMMILSFGLLRGITN